MNIVKFSLTLIIYVCLFHTFMSSWCLTGYKGRWKNQARALAFTVYCLRLNHFSFFTKLFFSLSNNRHNVESFHMKRHSLGNIWLGITAVDDWENSRKNGLVIEFAQPSLNVRFQHRLGINAHLLSRPLTDFGFLLVPSSWCLLAFSSCSF